MPTSPLSIDELQRAFADRGLRRRPLHLHLGLPGAVARPAAPARGRGGRRQDRARQGARRDASAPELIRLQCYEGLDVNTAVYEWNYPRQMLEIRLLEARGQLDAARVHDIFGPEFLLKRPLLQALEATTAAGAGPAHRRDRPCRRGVRGVPARAPLRLRDQHPGARARSAPPHPPRVVLTSNRTREVHDALKRRCLYHWIDYPTAQREYEIVLRARPGHARAARDRDRRLRPAAAGDRADEGPGRRRDARLGLRAPGARHATA